MSSLKSKNPESWNNSDVLAWFESLGLSAYADALKKNSVNGIILKEMTKDSLLQSCGIDNAFHRAVLVEKIRALFETGGKEMSKTESKISFPLVLLPDAKFGDWMAKISIMAKEGTLTSIQCDVVDQDVNKRVKESHKELDDIRKDGSQISQYNYTFNEMYLKTIATVAKRGLNTTILTCSQFGLTEASDLYYFTHGLHESAKFFATQGIKYEYLNTCTTCKVARMCPHGCVEFTWPIDSK